ncbi:putative vacuolar protein sorting-associated protein Ist1 [Helianthus annuus]|nr:putative vacuolar protein sorting-associated protein Ist1 [Helianthus annuus]KAJ0646647.1 putative vacuolar protein sorting-associated protein Ist1 [Helianthus annuus]
MGRKLDALLGRNFRTKKFKATVNLAMSRLTILKNQHHARLTVARSDIIQLLNLNHHEHALLRVGEVIKEQNMLDVLAMVDGYCHLLIQMVKLIEKERYCPDELKEPVSSLIFAAPRCGEFPELQEIRAILTARYGKEFKFAHGDIELRNSCGVNTRMVQKLSPRQTRLETRIKTLQEIANENDIVLKLGDLENPIHTEEEGESTNGDTARNSSCAASAALAVVEFSRLQSTGSDNTDSSNSGPKNVLGSIPDESKFPMNLAKTEETESEYESGSEAEPEHEHEHESEISKIGSDSDGSKGLEKTKVFNESNNEIIEDKSSDILSSKQKEFGIGSSKLQFGEVLKMQQSDLTKKQIVVRSF